MVATRMQAQSRAKARAATASTAEEELGLVPSKAGMVAGASVRAARPASVW